MLLMTFMSAWSINSILRFSSICFFLCFSAIALPRGPNFLTIADADLLTAFAVEVPLESTAADAVDCPGAVAVDTPEELAVAVMVLVVLAVAVETPVEDAAP